MYWLGSRATISGCAVYEVEREEERKAVRDRGERMEGGCVCVEREREGRGNALIKQGDEYTPLGYRR